jgi:hypothetical protein
VVEHDAHALAQVGRVELAGFVAGQRGRHRFADPVLGLAWTPLEAHTPIGNGAGRALEGHVEGRAPLAGSSGGAGDAGKRDDPLGARNRHAKPLL